MTTTKTINWLGDDVTVTRTYSILRDDHHYTAWTETNGEHGSVTFIDGTYCGRLGTERLPSSIDAMPALSDERSRHAKMWIESRYDLACRAIIAAFPEAAEGEQDMGSITVYNR